MNEKKKKFKVIAKLVFLQHESGLIVQIRRVEDKTGRGGEMVKCCKLRATKPIELATHDFCASRGWCTFLAIATDIFNGIPIELTNAIKIASFSMRGFKKLILVLIHSSTILGRVIMIECELISDLYHQLFTQCCFEHHHLFRWMEWLFFITFGRSRSFLHCCAAALCTMVWWIRCGKR